LCVFFPLAEFMFLPFSLLKSSTYVMSSVYLPSFFFFFFFFFYPQIVLSRERETRSSSSNLDVVYTHDDGQEREKSRVASSSSSSPYRSGEKKDREHHAVRWDAPSLVFFKDDAKKRHTSPSDYRISYKVYLV
jgi:hypothetical protein